MIAEFSTALLVFISLTSADDFTMKNTDENIQRLNNVDENDYPEMYSGQIEGDMILTPYQKELLYNGPGNHRTALVNFTKKWTNSKVPYTIAEEDFNWEQIEFIKLATSKLMQISCIKFVPYDKHYHKNYVHIVGQSRGCFANIGMNGGRQIINLGPAPLGIGCFKFYSIIHELVHTLGFVHMQCASERDEYIKIMDENIHPKRINNFVKYSKQVITQYGIDYDYESVMHYPANAFSINDQPTIIPLKSLNGVVMGQRERLSDKDIARINAMYCTENDQN